MLIILRDWGRGIGLSSKCDCQSFTVRRVLWPGVARRLEDNVKGQGEGEDIDKNGGVRP